MEFHIPVLLIIFNRPEFVRLQIDKLRDIHPTKLYVAADGPRQDKEGEYELCLKARKIIDLIDWNCEVKKLYRDNNIGCGLGVSSAISWFFENEELGIILEDDCMANQSFFMFSQELLEKYKNDSRIGMIAGHNELGAICSDDSYCFSKYKACWGWATWKRAWENFDLQLQWQSSHYKEDIIQNMGFQGKDTMNWKFKIKKIENKEVSAWDWQWYFSLSTQNQLCIFPAKNLISNIGFGANATHTSNYSNPVALSFPINFPMQHPKYIIPNAEFDYRFYKKNTSKFVFIKRLLPFKIRKAIKKIFRA